LRTFTDREPDRSRRRPCRAPHRLLRYDRASKAPDSRDSPVRGCRGSCGQGGRPICRSCAIRNQGSGDPITHHGHPRDRARATTKSGRGQEPGQPTIATESPICGPKSTVRLMICGSSQDVLEQRYAFCAPQREDCRATGCETPEFLLQLCELGKFGPDFQ
jgi:hypothetical protein